MTMMDITPVRKAYERLSVLLNDDDHPAAPQVTSAVGDELEEIRSLLQDFIDEAAR